MSGEHALMDAAWRVDPESEVMVTDLDEGEAVLLHLTSRKYFTLNASGLEIWRLLGEGLTLGEVSGQLVERYGIETERAAGAVSRLVAELRDAGLVRIRE
jgi:hypothetical protein